MPDPAATPVIRVRGLVSRFGTQVVHDGLDMEVQPNEIFGVVGGSGTGKSVLLRAILGLRAPDGGSVELYGKDVQQLAAADRSSLVRSYGVTFQNGALISSLTVAQNVQLPLREYYPASEQTLGELAELNLALVGLPPDAGAKYPSQLSGGMIKRAALARALALEPKLLLLDEPTAGLDPHQIIETRDLIKGLAARGEHTIILSTHILPEVEQTCERVIIIAKGKLVATDTVENLTSRLRGAETVSVEVMPREGEINAALVQASLEQVAGVSRVLPKEHRDNKVHFMVESLEGRHIRPGLARAVIDGGWNLNELHAVGLSLEEIFLQLTRENASIEQQEEEAE